jgi:hypothetical protein
MTEGQRLTNLLSDHSFLTVQYARCLITNVTTLTQTMKKSIIARGRLCVFYIVKVANAVGVQYDIGCLNS